MQAIQVTKYGAPDKVLRYVEIDKPVPADNEVLIKIHTVATNSIDWHRMRADPFLVRIGEGLMKPQNPYLGADIAGIVEAIGRDVTEFQIGDRVFACIEAGGFAEYACATEDQTAPISSGISFEQAASTPVVGFTAIQGLRNTGQIQAGQKVLINGASGGVGTFAVQYAKIMGAEVTGVCSGRNVDLVKSIGADHVVDYTQEDFTKNGEQYDLILDAVANHSVWAYTRALNATGRCVIVGLSTLSHLFHVILFGKLAADTDQSFGLMLMAEVNKDDLLEISNLLESGRVKPVIDRCYNFNEIPQAIAYLETKRARGKVVINIVKNSS